MSALFEEPPSAAKDPEFVRRAADHPHLDLGNIRKELLSPRNSRSLQFMVLKLAANSGNQPISSAAVKGGLVLAGHSRCASATRRPCYLRATASCSMDRRTSFITPSMRPRRSSGSSSPLCRSGTCERWTRAMPTISPHRRY